MLLDLCKNNKPCAAHFIGIGGISMSALAQYLCFRGFKVTGSDCCETEITEKLKKYGISVNGGEEDVRNADVVVVSSAIGEDDAELTIARGLNKPVVSRAELLRDVADCFKFTLGVSGTHGKTTCAAMTAHVFDAAGFAYTAHIGGEDDAFGNLSIKGDKYFITEVCEYKRNIARFSPHIGIVLNIDGDHLDSYKTMSALASEFYAYIGRSGVSVVNADDPLLHDCGANIRYSAKDKTVEYYACAIKHTQGRLSFKVYERGRFLYAINLSNSFYHNVYNALAATAAARLCGISAKDIKKGLLSFVGVKRRDEYIGTLGGAAVIADYAHHPEQIRKTLAELRLRTKGRLFVIFQPHTFSRTKLLIDEFESALKDERNLYIFKTYAAREKYDYCGCAEKLCERLPASVYCEDGDEMFAAIKKTVNSSDAVAVLGAGDIYYTALKNLDDKR